MARYCVAQAGADGTSAAHWNIPKPDMIKFLAGVLGFGLAFINAWIAYKFAKKAKLWIPQFNFAIMIAAFTLFFCLVVVVVLDQLGLYPD